MIPLLLRQLDQAYDRKSWHGPNLRGAIRGLSAETAAWRPRRDRHSIQEIVVHAAYWKYAVRRQLTGEARGAFPLAGSNWFVRPSADAARWREDVRLLADCHRRLRQAVAAVDLGDLSRPPTGRSVTRLDLISGVIAHDLYHAGQIQLLKVLQRPAAPRRGA